MDNNELSALVERSQAGETGAMEELLRAAYTPVSYQCRRFLKTGQDAEDMTQEVLLLLYTKLDTLQEPAAFWGWLGRLTANRCKNALSRTHTDLPILEDEEGNSVLDNIENEDRQLVPDEAFDNAETARMIGEIVDGLPEAQRACVLLYYYDEMNVKEIAEVTGTSENTVKSRLNYARKAIRENVLEYEKKQGIRLHSIAPVSLLFYFLRRAAEESTDSASAQEMVGKIMAEGAAVVGDISGGAAKTAGSAASHALKGISLKAAAGIAAGLLIAGGITAGIVAIVNNSQEEAVEEAVAMEPDSILTESMETPEPEETEEILEEPEEISEEEPLFPAETLASLPYTGDADQCKMTVSQAEAFADALDECIAESQEMGYSNPPFCRAALFDAGNGVPALFVVWGYDMGYGSEDGYMAAVSKIYYWNGEQVLLGCENLPQEETMFSNIAVTDSGLIHSQSPSTRGGYTEISKVYTLSDGSISEESAHIYEEFAFIPSDIPSAEECRTYITEHGSFGSAYDYDALTEEKWLFYPEGDETGGRWIYEYEGDGWIAAALDGKFISAEDAEKNRQTMTWYGAEWKLGHGDAWISDVSHYWVGEWADAAELAFLLRNGQEETAPDNHAPEGTGLPEDATFSMEGHILRMTLDSRGYDIEIYYEIPVFDDEDAGYQKINGFFRRLLDQFTDPENETLAMVWETVSEYPPEADMYYHNVSAQINEQTDKYVSISQTFSSYLGGVMESETTYYNFRTDTGEELLLTDLLDGTEEEIKEMVIDALEMEIQDAADIEGTIRGYAVEDFNFYILDGQVYLCFAPYEIYGMMYGPQVPFEIGLPSELKAEWR